MTWDGSGNFVRTDGTRTGATVWEQARDAGVLVNSAPTDTHDQDVADGLENCLTRDGQNSPTVNLPMNAKKHTGVADASANSEYAAYGQLLALVTPFVAAANVGGTATALTLAPTPAPTAYTTGRGYRFIVQTENTGQVTVTVGSLASVGIRRADGEVLEAGDFNVGRHVTMIFDGARFLSDIEGAGGGTGTITAVTATSPITATTVAGAVALSLSLTASDIPSLPASKVNSGTFNAARVGVSLTQVEYDALTPSASTLYLITG